jgi:hypothetical protein
MANEFFPFDSGAGASVQEAQWVKMARLWRESGVVMNKNGLLTSTGDFAVVANTGMSVKVKPGEAWVRGAYFKMDTDATVTLNAADPTNPRIDIVALRVDWVANSFSVVAVQGTPNANPSPPLLTQIDGNRYEIPLAYVRVNAGVSSITSSDITDVRPVVSNAGLVPAVNLTALTNRSVGAGATVTLQWDWEKFDPTQMHDTSVQNDRVNIKEPGIYFVYAMIFWKNPAATNINGTCNFSIYRNRNGTVDQIARDTTYIAATQGVQSCMKLIDCQPGDYLYVQASNNTSVNPLEIDASQPYSPYFGVVKLGITTGY